MSSADTLRGFESVGCVYPDIQSPEVIAPDQDQHWLASRFRGYPVSPDVMQQSVYLAYSIVIRMLYAIFSVVILGELILTANCQQRLLMSTL